jgi:hypothetical protein
VSLGRVLGTLTPKQHIETVRALYFDKELDQSEVPRRDALIALLQERAGDREGALETWRTVRTALGPDGDVRVVRQADAAQARLAPGGNGAAARYQE